MREKICPGKVRGRDGRVLHGSKLEAERELYMELDLPDLSHKRPFFMMFWKGSRSLSLMRRLAFAFRLIY